MGGSLHAMGRPKKITDAEILEIIARHGEISQRDLQKLVGLSKSALSERVNRLHEEGKIRIRKLRVGRAVLNMLSLVELEPSEAEGQSSMGTFLLEEQPPAKPLRLEEKISASKIRPSYQSLLLLSSIIFVSWSGTFLLFPLAGAIATFFGTITLKEVHYLLAIFLFLGGPLTLFWAWLEDRLSSKKYSSKFALTRKRLLIASLVVWAIGAFLSTIARNFGVFLSFQIVMTLGFAPISAVSISIALDLLHTQHAKRVFWLLDIVAILGMGCGSALAAVSIAFVPWQVSLLVLGTFGMVLSGATLGLETPKEPPQEQELNDERQRNPPLPRKRNKLRFLLPNIALNIALGGLIYYVVQILIPPHKILVFFLLFVFLAIYASHLLYGLFCLTQKDRRK